MTTDEWLNDCINEKWVEKMLASKFHRFFYSHYNASYKEDIIQEIYLILLSYPRDKLDKVVKEHPKSFIYKLLKRVIFSKSHPINKKLFYYHDKINETAEYDII